MNRSELVSHVAAGTSLSKSDAASAAGVVFQIIADALAGEEPVTIAASRTPALKTGKTLRESFNRTSSRSHDRRPTA